MFICPMRTSPPARPGLLSWVRASFQIFAEFKGCRVEKSSNPQPLETATLPRLMQNSSNAQALSPLKVADSMTPGGGVCTITNRTHPSHPPAPKINRIRILLFRLEMPNLIQNESKRLTLSAAYACAFRLIGGWGCFATLPLWNSATLQFPSYGNL